MTTSIMHPNRKGDWNWDIYIRDIKEEDFYNGLTVQSQGNRDTIYEIFSVMENGKTKWIYIPKWRILTRRIGYLQSELKQLENDKLHSRDIQDVEWTETFYSIKVNKIIRRDKLLEELIQS